ncbi:unnamed protein product [Cyclocybe aegerita]|uniref:Protein-S-isoprenylcysteine O-methyltransferase n=1 Tax=Cyclocybe aegerita TaxID=1973307 RepID=A0A8S0WZ73_CYCAE|nr:unnamed protein product [Cyclocybe aegerita]
MEPISSPAVINTFFLLATAASVHLSLSPPNPPVKSDECCSGTEGTNTLFEKFVQSITYCSKCIAWIGALCNILFILIRHHELFVDRRKLTEKYARSFLHEAVHPAMVIGAISAVLATVLRMWCFKTLGPFFTFEITIRPRHELITHGPYSWVRHPSYTGVFLTLSGATLALGAPGTWVAESGVWTPLGFAVAAFWLLKCGFAFRSMCVRLKAEDAVLCETFGAEWEAYASRVPCKFIPGIV